MQMKKSGCSMHIFVRMTFHFFLLNFVVQRILPHLYLDNYYFEKLNTKIEYYFILGATVVSWRVNNQEQLFVR